MQFKTLAVAAVAAIATVSAYDSNACTACVYASIPKDTVCATLNATTLTELSSVFGNTTFDLPKLSGLIQDPTVKSCVCHWATDAFTPTGSAASCSSGTPPTCNTTQLQQASEGISAVVPTLCSNTTTTGGAANPSGSAPATATPSTKPSAAGSINVPYVVSIAAIGLAALAGF